MMNHRHLHKIFFCLITTLLTLCVAACGNTGNTPNLDTLDKTISKSHIYIQKALQRADSAANTIPQSKNPQTLLQRTLETADVWMPLDLSKSLIYLQSAYDISKNNPTCHGDSNLIKIKIASLYNSQGSMLKEAVDIFNQLKENDIADTLKLNYYILAVQLNRALAERSFDNRLRNIYLKRASDYRDSVLAEDPGSAIIAVNKLMENGKNHEALTLLRSTNSGADKYSREMGPYYHYMAEIFATLNEPDSQIHYLALSAITDLRNGVREYKALPQLAEKLKTTDINRAYTYINKSERDAESSNSELRQKEIAPSLREINALYNARQKQQKYLFIFLISGLFVLAVFALIWIRMLRTRNRRLREYMIIIDESKDQLARINKKLHTLNLELEEQSAVKEHYVRSFMELSLSYLNQMETFRAGIAKLCAKGNWTLLSQRINSSRYVNKEISEFYDNFDRAFLSIYPKFTASLNSLLKPEERYDEKMDFLTTELRIYALIRLGVTESNQIAKFLRCSESTVYNYRTKMRNRAINRADFEKDFFALSSAGLDMD